MGRKPYYDKGGITIYHGDCLEVMGEFEDGGFDLVLTDPPYKHKHIHGGGFPSAYRFFREGALDGLNQFDLAEYKTMLINAAPMMIAFCSRDLVPDYAALARATNRKWDLHIWHKTNAVPFTANTWKSDIEYLALIWEEKPGWKQCEQKKHSKVYTSSLCRDNGHPTAKPIPLLMKYIEVLDAETIVDPFAGSGTTGRAAKNLNRKAILIEKKEQYCEIAAKRMAQHVLPF